MVRSLLAVAALCATTALYAEAPYLVTDLNTQTPSPVSSAPSNFRAVNGRVVFQARHADSGVELWQESGGQVALVKDINPGPYSDGLASSGSFVSLADSILFAGLTWESDRELWKTDGTADGTVLIKDINPMGGSNIVFRGGVGTLVLFTATDGIHGSEPWVTDGTASGTRMLINLDGTSSSTTVTAVGTGAARSFIFARNSVWVTDGTPEGTTTSGVTILDPRSPVVIGMTVYFIARTNETGYELWKSDGTVAGTSIVTELVPGTGGGFTQASARLTVYNGKLYFVTNAPGSTTVRDLWTSDGTAAGTQVVKAGIANAPVTPFPVVAGSLLWVPGNQLWRSDGTTAGTTVVAPFPVETTFSAFSGAGFVRVNGSAYELWKSDGTAAGTSFIASFPSWISSLTFINAKLYFTAESAEAGYEPWVSDGTSAGTRMLANIGVELASSASPFALTGAGNLVYFLATDGTMRATQLFRSDGTGAGTFRLTNIGDGYNSPSLSLFTAWNGNLYFKELYAKLWKSDGTVAGTAILKNFSQGYNTPSVHALFPASSFLYLDADDGDGSVPWRTDGTSAGIIDLGAVRLWANQPTYPGSFAELAGRVYTHAHAHNPGIFVLGSTAADTKRITKFEYDEAIQTPLVAGAGALVFGRRTRAHGRELWKSDGTIDGTVLVKDIHPGEGSSGPDALTPTGRYVYFVADDGAHGKELWRTDATEAGTIRLSDIVADAGTAEPMNLTVLGDLLYFTALNGSGRALWRSDGTAEGTRKVADISANANPIPLHAIGGTLYFAAEDATHGRELWKTTGDDTIAMVADLEPGTGSSFPADVVRAGNLIYFSAITRAVGRELWAMPLTGASATTISVGDLRLNEGQGGSVIVTRGGDLSGAASVTFTTTDGSAAAGSDYTAASGTVSFAAGETTKSIGLASLPDAALETEESFFLALASPTGATIGRGTATVVIQDDDRRAELKLEWLVPQDSPFHRGRAVKVTNLGPSTATDVVLRYSESPGRKPDATACDQAAVPFDCTIDPLAPGASTTYDFHGWLEGYTDPLKPPGSTIHVSVRARELDTNPADNSLAKMMAGNSDITLPPFLTVGTPATANILLMFPAWRDELVTLTSSSTNVSVSPASVTVPQNQSTTQFTLTPSAAGSTVLTLQHPQGTTKVHVPIAAPGTTPKLDVAIVVQSKTLPFGETATIGARISAVKPDGTRPTGTVSLFDDAGTLIATKAIDANAEATFTRSGHPPGTYWYTFSYSGDANFNALAGARAFVQVQTWWTDTTVEVPPMICGAQDVTIFVRNEDTNDPPTGTVQVTVGTTVVGSAPLQPTGVAGESRAVYRHTFVPGDSYISVMYQPAGTFRQSGDGQHFFAAHCVAMNMRATAIAKNQVHVTWSATNAHHYEIVRSINKTNWTIAGTTTATSFVDNDVSEEKPYLYTVRAVDASNKILSQSPPDLAMTIMFTNDPLVAGATAILGKHIQETEVATMLLEWFGGNVFVTPTLGAKGTPFRASHIVDLRSRINASRMRLGLPAFTFTGTPVAGTFVRAQHLQELREAVK